MPNWKKARSKGAIFLIFFVLLLSGCAGGQNSQQTVSPLYMLTESGFHPWPVNMETPKRQALLDAIPRGKIVTYRLEGAPYYVYAEENANILYVGDEAAHQKYLSMTKGQQLCERVEGKSQQEFWSCFEEFQAKGARPGGR